MEVVEGMLPRVFAALRFDCVALDPAQGVLPAHLPGGLFDAGFNRLPAFR
ncbi:hypothetical protein X907_2277 [Glycocaulis alkaliphilus]|uniref:Uncharacterized protein n=1 Tax=Glycocaulis alkaliphilus TaxID=1434191 RepID=A0A3T0EBS8_9PROT|nr:hypothetical protein X907_2277 [Glycocaulis alkaliphilus]